MPKNLDGFKQGITFLLTIPGIPQIYYGTELLMNGNKSKSDGDIRKDVPGGWPGDSVNQFTAEGRSALQNEAFDFMQKLLKWRQGNEILAKGKMRHYVPQNGVYVYERYLNGKSILVFMNGTSKEAEIDLDRYAESLKGKSSGFDVLSNQQIHFNSSMKLLPREIHIVEL
jgi:glycosidase